MARYTGIYDEAQNPVKPQRYGLQPPRKEFGGKWPKEKERFQVPPADAEITEWVGLWRNIEGDIEKAKVEEAKIMADAAEKVGALGIGAKEKQVGDIAQTIYDMVEQAGFELDATGDKVSRFLAVEQEAERIILGVQPESEVPKTRSPKAEEEVNFLLKWLEDNRPEMLALVQAQLAEYRKTVIVEGTKVLQGQVGIQVPPVKTEAAGPQFRGFFATLGRWATRLRAAFTHMQRRNALMEDRLDEIESQI